MTETVSGKANRRGGGEDGDARRGGGRGERGAEEHEGRGAAEGADGRGAGWRGDAGRGICEGEDARRESRADARMEARRRKGGVRQRRNALGAGLKRALDRLARPTEENRGRRGPERGQRRKGTRSRDEKVRKRSAGEAAESRGPGSTGKTAGSGKGVDGLRRRKAGLPGRGETARLWRRARHTEKGATGPGRPSGGATAVQTGAREKEGGGGAAGREWKGVARRT